MQYCYDEETGLWVPGTPIFRGTNNLGLPTGCILGFTCPDGNPPRPAPDPCKHAPDLPESPGVSFVDEWEYCYDPSTQLWSPAEPIFDENLCLIGFEDCPFDPPSPPQPPRPQPPNCPDIPVETCVDENGDVVQADPIYGPIIDDEGRRCIIGYTCPDGSPPEPPPIPCGLVEMQYCYDEETNRWNEGEYTIDDNGCPKDCSCPDGDPCLDPFPPTTPPPSTTLAPCPPVPDRPSCVEICDPTSGVWYVSTAPIPVYNSNGCIIDWYCDSGELCPPPAECPDQPDWPGMCAVWTGSFWNFFPPEPI